MLSKVNRLKGKKNFETVFKRGERFYSPYFVVYRLKQNTSPENGSIPPRIGIIASKKVGGSVVRNQARRNISESIRCNFSKFENNTTYVFIAFKQISTATFAQVKTAIEKLF